MAEPKLDPGLLIPGPFPCIAPALPLRDCSENWAVPTVRLLHTAESLFVRLCVCLFELRPNCKKVAARGRYKGWASQAEDTAVTNGLRQVYHSL